MGIFSAAHVVSHVCQYSNTPSSLWQCTLRVMSWRADYLWRWLRGCASQSLTANFAHIIHIFPQCQSMPRSHLASSFSCAFLFYQRANLSLSTQVSNCPSSRIVVRLTSAYASDSYCIWCRRICLPFFWHSYTRRKVSWPRIGPIVALAFCPNHPRASFPVLVTPTLPMPPTHALFPIIPSL